MRPGGADKLYRALNVACVVAFLLLGLAIYLWSPRPDPLRQGLLTAGTGLIATATVFRPGPRQAVAGWLLLCAMALLAAIDAPVGVAAGIAFPFLGALLVGRWHQGRRLAATLVISWLVSVLCLGLAFEVGPLTAISAKIVPFVTEAYAAIMLGLVYSTVWWIANRWRLALREAGATRVLAEDEGRRYRSLFEESGDAILVSDDDFAILDANPALCSLLGYSIDEVRSMTYLDLVDPSALPMVQQARVEMKATRQTRVAERRLRAKDGSYRLVELSVRTRPDGNVQTSMRDITERRATEEELHRTTQMLQTLVETSPVPIGALLADHTGLVWNKAAEKAYGWTQAEVVGHAWPEAFTPQGDRETSDARIRRALAGETVMGERAPRLTKDGRDVTVDIYAAALCDSDGSAIGIAGLLVDVTEQVAMEAQLRQAAKMEAIGQLAGGVAHDFNNILTAVRGYAELVRRSLLDTQQAEKRDVDEIVLAADRAAALTHQLLAFARRTVREPQVLDPATVVSNFSPLLRRLLGEHIELALELPRGIWIKADLAQLEQVILNLAVNARDAMPIGGCLTIKVEQVATDADYAKTHPAAQTGLHCLLYVSDTGSGIDESVRKHMFEPFFTTKDPGKGTGMGLSTVLGIVQMSGGWIDVESTVGVGTTFRVYFPLASPEPGGPAEEAGPARIPTGTETILLVEDDPSVRSFARRCLMSLGYAVLEAADSTHALSLAGDYPASIDLLLTDVVMPGLQGPEMASRVLELRPDLKVLYVSGFAASLVGGATESAYLAKPYSREGLARAVRDTIDG